MTTEAETGNTSKKMGQRKICRQCTGARCAECQWPPTMKYPTRYDGPKMRSTKGMDQEVV